MPTPQEAIDQFAALHGSGSQIPGIVREGNSYSAAPGSLLRGELDSADAASAARRAQVAPRPGGGFFSASNPSFNPNGPRGAFPQVGDATRGTIDDVTSAINSGRYGEAAGLAARGAAATAVSPLATIASAATPMSDAVRAFFTGASEPHRDRYGNDLTQTRNAQRQLDELHGRAPQTLVAQPEPANIGHVDKAPRRQTSFTETGTGGAQPGALLRDGFGNSLAATQSYQRQLDGVRAEDAALADSRQAAAERAPGASYEEQQRAKADRFTRFVNESSTASLLHDLGKGGGTARTNAGMIEAARNSQLRDFNAQDTAARTAAQQLDARTKGGAQAVISKGQQLQHEAALAQVLGSPAHQQGQLLDAAIKARQLDSAQVLQSLQQKLLDAGKNKDTDGQARYALLIQQLQGRTPENKLVAFGGGQVADPVSGQLITQPSRLAYTGPPPGVIGEGRPTAPAPQIGDTLEGVPDGSRMYAGTKIRIKDGKIVAVGDSK